uniref:Uncharacterized protein n=1 Tax=Arundo donax TaxID=35708 RepID=A0A0A8Y3I1_ARUDO
MKFCFCRGPTAAHLVMLFSVII